MICECCGKDHDGTFGSGRFCSRSCANTHKHNESWKLNISKSLKKYHNLKPKSNICKFCGQNLEDGNHDICKLHQSVNWYKKLIPFGFDFSKIGTIEFFNEYEKAISLLITEYEINELSPKQIFEKYKLSRYFKSFETILPILKQLGIQTRDLSQSLLLAIEKGRVKLPNSLNLYHSGWHTTWLGTEVYYRSSYELDYAKMLDDNKIRYDMECLKIKYWDSISQKFRCAIPDFYLPDTNEIVEIKSKYTFNETEMIDKFNEYRRLGYKPKLILDHKEYNI